MQLLLGSSNLVTDKLISVTTKVYIFDSQCALQAVTMVTHLDLKQGLKESYSFRHNSLISNKSNKK